ncbi:MAG: Ig-like domain-containing protein [Nocardioides sp.]
MTSPSRRRWIAPALALSLGLGVVGGLAAPATAASTTFSNNTRIYMNDPSERVYTSTAALTIPDSGTASQYPSQITVPHDATVEDLDVRLTGLTHSDAYDLDIMLVGPHGQQVTLMSDVAGSASNVNFIFDDASATSLPTAGFPALTSGTYKPTRDTAVNSWPAPAPVSTGNKLLSTFNGTDAGGVWSLYVNDAASSDSGTLTSWGLEINFATRPYPSTIPVTGLPPISDVNVTLSGVDSEFLDDVELLLVGPGGQQSILMSDVGDNNTAAGATFVIDDEAAAPFADLGPIPSGTYQPTNIGTGDSWPSPAPVATGNVPLSIFDGVSPNGDWSLYADDCCGSDLTSIGGWSLQFTWADTQLPTGTVSVNGGAASTSSTAVTLGLSANDPAPATGVTQMRFSNDGVTFSAYQAYATSAAWNLASGDGVKTVYAQFKDGEGNQSAVVSDSITFQLPDTTSPTAGKTTPKKNAKGVKVTTKVKVKASEALKASTVNAKTVYLKAKGSSKKVKAKVSYNAKGKTIVLTPKSSLKKGTKYTMTVTTKVKDAAGNKFDGKPKRSGAQAFSFSFTTA